MTEDKESEQDNLNDPYFIYLIEVHNKNLNFETSLTNNYGIKSSNIELLEQKDFSDKEKFKYIYKVYRIKILLENIQFEISIQFKEKNNIFKKEITNKDKIQFTSHVFLYNFKAFDKNQNNYLSKNSLDSYPLNNYEQFKIYLNIVKGINKADRTSKEYQDCIIYIMNILKQIEYEFNFYISVLVQCFDTSNICKFLKLFKTEKLTKLGELYDEDLSSFKNIINKITQKPNLVLDKINGEEKYSARITLYAIILIFDLKFQKEKLNLIYWNENLLFCIFSQYYHFIKFFDYNIIDEIISLTDECFPIVYILNSTRDYLLDKFSEEKKIKEKKGEKERDLIINVGNYIKFKEEEQNLDKILVLIESLIEYQKEKKIQFIYFPSHFFQDMTELINEKNIEQLFILKKIVKSIKTFDTSLKYCKIDIDNIIEDIINKSIVNKNFNFLKANSENLINYLQKNDKYSDLYAIKLIQNNEKNEEFLKNRKEKKRKHDKNFISNACSVVTSLDQFDLLFEILFEGKENKDFLKSALISTQKTFLLICKQYTNEKLIIYLDIISALIYKSDLNLEEENVNFFLERLEKSLNKDFIINLYVNVLNKYQKLSINTIHKIHNFLEILDSKYIAILIKDLKENNMDFIKRKLSKYIIKEEEFFDFEDSNSFKILNLLLSYGIFPKKDSPNIFLKETYNRIESIRNRIRKNDFTYKKLYSFFLKENIQKFSDRISLLYIIDNKEMINNFHNQKSFVTIQQSLENKYQEIKKYIDLLCIYRDYLTNFITNKYSVELREINKLILYIEENKVNNFNIELISQIEKYEKMFGQKAKECIKFSKSVIFMDIKNNETKYYKDEDQIIDESLRKFKQSREIFNKDGFNSLNGELISIYLNALKGKKENEISEELKKILNFLDIKNPDNSIGEIIDTLSLFSKKDIFIKITDAVNNFINQTGAIKEETKNLNFITEINQNIFNKDILIKSIKVLGSLDKDLINKENYFVQILLSLRQKPEAIKFLLLKDKDEFELLYGNLDNNDFLRISDVIDLEKCVEYMKSLGSIDEFKQMKDYELIKKAKYSNLISKNLVINFNNFINHFEVIKERIFDKSEEGILIKINCICQNSSFYLSSNKKNYFEGKYFINDEEKIDKSIVKVIKLNELKELRDRAILIKNPIDKNNENKHFIDMVSGIMKLSKLLNDIYNYGYIKFVSIRISTKNYTNTFSIISPENLINKSENVEDILVILKNFINNLKLNYKIGYRNLKYLRFIYGRQFNIIYDYLHKFKDSNYNNIYPFLKFITNNELKNNKINYKWTEDNKNDEFQNIIDNCADFIKKILSDNNLSLKNIYDKTLIKKRIKLENEEYK